MVKRMLIDATHSEETRVVVVNGTRLEELDVETSTKRQLKGNIYLAKIVRVEPSLQAAFVEYGGNRHGFLAFSEIHPDYFQIPVADRQALLAAQRAEVMREVGDHDHHDGHHEDHGNGNGEGHLAAQAVADAVEAGGVDDAPAEKADGDHHPGKHHVETVGGDDDVEAERRRARLLRNYKIQEVIKRRQIMLVQVVKEERGNKGAALTTYLSLAGRYCVLMPNTARGGGVSRKIINATDRRRLKSIANEMEIPDGMAVIIRTAGSERSKAEIRRDYEYLLRMWDSVRELTLKSTAPALVYEEASLIKRSIRDLYSRDLDEVLVEGDEGYRLAKDYMRMLTPSHAKKVQPYKDPIMPMFHRYQVESQLDAMHSPIVQLRSGGYIVINQTEALVAIDVNSGRATKERHIEETALKTNGEAAEEIARQLRLRDLAGLIVIDFIDMEENRNNHAVERRLKDALKNDRARIQVGKISAFGLLELSRQRLRPSLQETTFTPCPHCAGSGLVRSVESAAVHVLRAIEEEGIRHRSSEVTVTVSTAIALYILNQKRSALATIEERYDFTVLLAGDDSLIPPNFRMERIKAEYRPEEAPRPITTTDQHMIESSAETETEDAEEDEEDEAEEAPAQAERGEAHAGGEGGDQGERKKRRRRRRKRRGDEQTGAVEAAGTETAEAGDTEADGEAEGEGESEGEGDDAEGEVHAEGADGADGEGRKRRRGRRGGRRRRRRENGEGVSAEAGHDGEAAEATAADASDAVMEEAPAEAAAAAAVEEAAPKRKRAPRRKAGEAAPAEVMVDASDESVAEAADANPAKAKPAKAKKATKPKAPAKAPVKAGEAGEPAEKPKRPSRAKKAPAEAPIAAEAEAAPPVAEPVAEVVTEIVAEPVAEIVAEPVAEPVAQIVAEPAPKAVPPVETEPAPPPVPAGPPKRGWWNRLIS